MIKLKKQVENKPAEPSLEKKSFDRSERRNLQILNLFRLLVGMFFFLLANSSIFRAFYPSDQQHHLMMMVSVFYLVCSIIVFIISYLSNRDDASLISKFTFIIDLFVMTYVIYASNGINYGLAILPVLVIGSSAILFERTLYILLMPVLASVLLWGLPVMIDFDGGSSTQYAAKLFYTLAYFLIALLGARQSSSHSRVLKLYRTQRKTISGLGSLNQIIIEKLSSGVVIYKKDYVVLDANQTAKDLLSIRKGKKIDKQTIDLLKSGKQTHVYQTEQGNTLYLRPIEIDPDENFNLLFIEDSSFLKKAAQQISLASLGQMSSSIAHEIRNPLASINTAAELLQESEGLAEEDKQIAQIITNNVKRANSIIEDILQISRRSSAKPQKLLLKALLKEVKQDAVTQIKVDPEHIIINNFDSTTKVNFDPNHIKQILWNLTSNALRHGEDGKLTIEAKDHHLDFMNRGKPFDQHKTKNLFEPFFTTHNRGTGLGLYVCRELCHDNHAKLTYLYDEPHHVFRLTFNLSNKV